MIRLFVCYSHADNAFRSRLETQLALLKRQGLLDVWTDQAILPGQEIDPVIAAELEAADVIVLLVSPNFIASNYCYEKEMTRAVERHRAAEAIVIRSSSDPVRGSRRRSVPSRRYRATWKPVSKYDDPDDAWHEVETEIRRLIKDLNRKRAGAAASEPSAPTPATARAPASAAVKLPRSFSDADRDDFVDEAFDKIAYALTASLQELRKCESRGQRTPPAQGRRRVHNHGVPGRQRDRGVPRVSCEAVPHDRDILLVRGGRNGDAVQREPLRCRRRCRNAPTSSWYGELRKGRPHLTDRGRSRGLSLAATAAEGHSLRHAECSARRCSACQAPKGANKRHDFRVSAMAMRMPDLEHTATSLGMDEGDYPIDHAASGLTPRSCSLRNLPRR
jgi:hypothetical protein